MTATLTKATARKKLRAIKAARRRGRKAAKRRRQVAVQALDPVQIIGFRLLRLNEICAVTGLSRTTVWRKARDATDSFPAPMMLASRTPAWSEPDIIGYLEGLRAASQKTALPPGAAVPVLEPGRKQVKKVAGARPRAEASTPQEITVSA